MNRIFMIERRVCFFWRRLLAMLLLSAAPVVLLAQAGSRPALLFDSADSFYHSIAGSLPAPVIAGQQQPVIPQGVLSTPDTMQYLLWVELEQGRLSILERVNNESMVLKKRMPVSIGKKGIGKQLEGDQKTPVGVYRFTSFLSDQQLDDFYGDGAYPLNYPNPRDAQLGRTGHGIWLHGLPKETQERPLLDSDGCVVIDNESLLGLEEIISRGETLIVLSPNEIRWVDASEANERRTALNTAIKTWKEAWEARNNPVYLDAYAADFSDLRRNKEQWSEYKTRVNGAKKFITINFSSLTMVADPVDSALVTVRYFQDYRSDNYSWAGWKEQVWREEPSGWKILFEGNG